MQRETVGALERRRLLLCSLCSHTPPSGELPSGRGHAKRLMWSRGWRWGSVVAPFIEHVLRARHSSNSLTYLHLTDD